MPVIEVADLRKRYGDKVAVDGVSFAVERSEIFGILGPNGAGKTTTVECISGLRKADGGSISVLGLDPVRDHAALRKRFGIQLQETALQSKLQVAEALDLYSSFYENPADWEELLDRLGLGPHRNVPYGKLSGGHQQRLSIALALVGNPEIAVLDELTTGLDPQARRETWALIEGVRDAGVTVVLVTHFMEEAERLCDRIAVIDSGRIIALDTPDGLVTSMTAENRLSFRPSVPVDEAELRALPEVKDLHAEGTRLTVTGDRNVVQAVISLLARNHIVAEDLRVEQTSLDDAFVELTRHDA